MLNDLIRFANLQNIAEELDDDTLGKLGEKVVNGFNDDVSDRSEWDNEMQDAMDLALQIMEQKTFPWKGASNVKVPLLTEAAVQYNAKMYPALVPTTDIVKPRIVGNDPDGQKRESGIRVSKHMSYQMLEEMEEWEEEMDRGLIVQPILGNMYKKTYYCPMEERDISEMLTPHEFIMCNNAKSIDKSYRKTHHFPMSENDVRSQILMGNFLEVELGEANYRKEDVEASSITHDYHILEQHTYADLDNDGLEEPYIVTVEKDSKNVLRVTAGYDVDEILHREGEVIQVPQEQYFTKYGFMPNPTGSIMDLGLGKLLGPINHSVNTLINQLIDAGTKSNMGGGFLGRGVRIKGGKMTYAMGEYKRVDASGDDIRKNIIHLPTNEPSSVLFSLLSFLVNAGQRLASTLDAQVGENPGQNQKATTTIEVVKAGQQIFGGIYKRNHRALKREIKRIFYLNSKNLPPASYLNVLDGIPPELGDQIFKTDYDMKSLNIVPTADSQYVPQQVKMMKAQALLQKIPTGMVNPQVAMKRALEAEEQVGIEEIMTVPQAGPSPEQIEMQQNIIKLQMEDEDRDDKRKLEREKLQAEIQLKTRDQVLKEKELGLKETEIKLKLGEQEIKLKEIDVKKETNIRIAEINKEAQKEASEIESNKEEPEEKPKEVTLTKPDGTQYKIDINTQK